MNLREKPFYLTEQEEAWVYDTLKSLSTEQKVGQLFCVMAADRGPELSELKKMVSDYSVGGILYRPAPAEWIRAQYAELDTVATVPLIKAANLEEGGSGAISDGTFFSWPLGVAATSDTQQAAKQAQVCANEGRSVGVNLTFSPVTDINYNYQNPITNIRTYGSDPDKVLDYCKAYVKTLQEGGVAACAKHFPGDGVDFRDQHLHPTYNTLSAEQWYSTYGRNYKALIDDGLMAIMAAHIAQPYVSMDVNPELELKDCMPATLSRELLTGVLREKYGFNGLIVSDATIMTGFIQAMERKRAIPYSIACGLDMLVFSINFYEDYQYMLDGIASGTLSMERLDEAVTRSLALKAAMGRFSAPTEIDPANKALQADCVDKSITLVKNIRNIFPLTPEKFSEVILVPLGHDKTGEGGSITEVFTARMKKEGFNIIPFDAETMRVKGSMNLSDKRLYIHVANIGAISNNTAVRLYWNMMGAADAPKFVNEENDVFISFASPYHLQDVPRVKTYINCYNNNEAAINAVIDKMLGKSEFVGVSPVDASCGLIDTML